MKYMKKFESFEEYKGLPSKQEEDLREIFYEFIKIKDFDYAEAVEYFQPKSESFANFLKMLENDTNWFDYRQMDQIFHEISFYLEEMKGDEEDDVDFNEN